MTVCRFSVGSDGEMNQITDDSGRTLFEPGLSAPPAQWSDIRQDGAMRIPNILPISLPSDVPMQAQIYAGIHMTGTTHNYDVVATPGVAAHTPYEMGVSTGKLSSTFSIPGTPGVAERITMEKIATSNKAVSLTIPSNGEAKSVDWTVTGLNKYRWAQLSSLAMVPSQAIKVRLENAGYRVIVNNNGPATSANLTVATDRYRSGVSVGTINIPNGDSTIEFELPTSSMTVTGQAVGKNGWLVAPVTITLNAVVYSSAGLDALEYGHDQVNWTAYMGRFPTRTRA